MDGGGDNLNLVGGGNNYMGHGFTIFLNLKDKSIYKTYTNMDENKENKENKEIRKIRKMLLVNL